MTNSMKSVFYIFLIITLLGCVSRHSDNKIKSGKDYIRPWGKNKKYWEYEGKPILLLGGTKNDNLFQSQNPDKHLDELKSVGGNYIRNTMSSRDTGNVWPFQKLANGKYDLDKWGEEYWDRFEQLLKLTRERGIIVQLEIWDRFDFSRGIWKKNPWNPLNNINYSSEETGLAAEYPKHPAEDKQPFFHSVPGMPRYTDKLDKVRYYQNKYVDKLLSYTLDYGNVLYCMDNETSTPSEWGKYWINYIKTKAGEKGVDIYLTDMFDRFFRPRECVSCRKVLEQADIYSFIDISQINSRNFHQAHWDTLQWILTQRDKYPLRPVNSVKVYGGMNSSWGSGSNKDGVERFCRDIIGGCASARHHRPPHGNGLNGKSKASIRAIRKVETIVWFWNISPRMDLLSDREPDEAYLSAKEGKNYVIYFPDSGSVKLNLKQYPKSFTLKWISVESGDWDGQQTFKGGDFRKIVTPGKAGWFAVIFSAEK